MKVASESCPRARNASCMATDARVCPHPTELLQNVTRMGVMGVMGVMGRSAKFRQSVRMCTVLGDDAVFRDVDGFGMFRWVRLPASRAQKGLNINDFEAPIRVLDERRCTLDPVATVGIDQSVCTLFNAARECVRRSHHQVSAASPHQPELPQTWK